MKRENELNLDFSFFDWTVSDLKNQVKVLKNLQKDFYTKIFAITNSERNFENTILVADNFYRDFAKISSRVGTIINLHTDKTMRDAAQKVEIEIGNIGIDIDNNFKLFLAINSYLQNADKQKTENLNGVQKHIISESVKSYKRSGMYLNADLRKVLKQKQKKLQKLESDYSLDYNKLYSLGIWVKQIDLQGVPEAIYNNWEYRQNKTGEIERLVKYVDRSIAMSYISDKLVREKVYNFINTLGSYKNLQRLQDAVALRQEVAQMLGYKNYLEYSLETQLINTANKQKDFFENFDKAIYKLAKKEWKSILQFSKTLNIGKLEAWDLEYVTKKMEEARVGMSSEKVSEYLEYENILSAIFALIKNTFDIDIKQVVEDKKLFHESARLYEWTDIKSKKVLGYSLLDLFPREGKYGHFCVSGCDLNTESSKYNTKVLIANFQVMKKEGKYLLSFSDVNSMLHEIGHMMHAIVYEGAYQATKPFSTSLDFVEIPSQFMECFWEEDKYLKTFLKHFKTNKTLAAKDLILLRDKAKALIATGFARTLDLAMIDSELHGENYNVYTNDKSLEKLRLLGAESFSKISKEKNIQKHKQQILLATFGHLMGGYQARYYSYLASYAYMREVWEFFKKDGIDKKQGIKFKKEFLSVGSTKSESDIFKNYMNKIPNLNNFKKFLNSI